MVAFSMDIYASKYYVCNVILIYNRLCAVIFLLFE